METGPVDETASEVLVPLRETGTLPALFIVHGRLGQAFISPRFLELLGEEMPAWAFQARGLDGVHEPHATIEAMAADYVRALRVRQPEGPYFLAALCAGAMIANVMARMLRDAGGALLPLLLLDPPEMRKRASIADAALLNRIRGRRSQFAGSMDDPEYATASVRVARAFEMAIWEHEPVPYDGPVYVLSSRNRMGEGDSDYLSRLFTCIVGRVEVGAKHTDVLDPRNRVFAEHLTRFLARILAEAPRPIPERASSIVRSARSA